MKQLFSLSIKIFGLYFILQSLTFILQLSNLIFTFLFNIFSNNMFENMFVIQFLYVNMNIVFYAVLGIILLIKSDKIASIVIKQDTEYPINIPVTTVLSISIFVMGGLIIINECESFIKLLGNKLFAPMFNIETFHFIASFVKILIGIFFISCNKWLVDRIYKNKNTL